MPPALPVADPMRSNGLVLFCRIVTAPNATATNKTVTKTAPNECAHKYKSTKSNVVFLTILYEL